MGLLSPMSATSKSTLDCHADVDGEMDSSSGDARLPFCACDEFECGTGELRAGDSATESDSSSEAESDSDSGFSEKEGTANLAISCRA